MDEAVVEKTAGFTRYTYDYWMKVFPDSNYADYCNNHMPFNFAEYVLDVISECGNNAISEQHPDISLDEVRYKPVFVNDEIHKWLEENGLENTTENRAYYASNPNHAFDPEENFKMLKQNKLNISRYVLWIPIYIEYKDADNAPFGYKIRFSEELTAKISEVFTSDCPEDVSIYCPGVCVSPDTVINRYSDFMRYDVHGSTPQIDAIQDTYQIEENKYLMTLPLVLTVEFNEPSYTTEELEEILSEVPFEFYLDDMEYGSELKDLIKKDIEAAWGECEISFGETDEACEESLDWIS